MDARSVARHEEYEVVLRAVKHAAACCEARAECLARVFSGDYFTSSPRPRTLLEASAVLALLPRADVLSAGDVAALTYACELAGYEHAPAFEQALRRSLPVSRRHTIEKLIHELSHAEVFTAAATALFNEYERELASAER